MAPQPNLRIVSFTHSNQALDANVPDFIRVLSQHSCIKVRGIAPLLVFNCRGNRSQLFNNVRGDQVPFLQTVEHNVKPLLHAENVLLVFCRCSRLNNILELVKSGDYSINVSGRRST